MSRTRSPLAPVASSWVVDQLVVLINGPAGIGKTSVGLRVAARAANGACIPCDTRKRFIVTRAEPITVKLGLAYVAATALTDVFPPGRHSTSSGAGTQSATAMASAPTAPRPHGTPSRRISTTLEP